MFDLMRPLFRRLLNREVVLFTATKAGSHLDPRTGNPFTGIFAGEFLLNSELGTIWNDLTQTGALTLSESPWSQVGGIDEVKITANGSGITVPGSWINVGSDAIDPANGKINRLMVKKTASEIQYVVKVT